MAITINKAPDIVSLTGNPIWYEMQTSLTHFRRYIHCQLQVYYGGEWIDASEEEDKIETDFYTGIAIFRIQALLNKYLVQKFTFPESDSQLMITQSGMSIQFRIKYKESWTTSLGVDGEDVSYVTDASTYYAIKGGVPNELLAILNTAQTSWWNEMVLNKQFCTWQPKEKTTYPGSVEKLYWIARRTATETLSIVWTATDDTTGTISKTLAATIYNVIECCISPALVESLAEKEIDNYIVSISGQSEDRTFTVSRKYFERTDNFIFDNSLACFDCLTALGWRKETGNNERSSYQKQFPLYPELTDRTQQNSRAIRKDSNESNTGFLLTSAWLEYMRELDLSRDAYILEGSLTRAVNIETEEGITLNDDPNFLMQYAIKWSFAHKNRYSGKFYGALRCPIPPYFTNALAMFDRRISNKLIDRISGAEASIDATGITFPVLGTDVFDKTNATYWGATIPNTAGNNRKWLFAELDWEFMVDYAEDTTHGILFLKDFGTDVRSTLPILVFSPSRTEAEQSEIVKYLDTYSFIIDSSGAIVQDSEGAYVVDGTI